MRKTDNFSQIPCSQVNLHFFISIFGKICFWNLRKIETNYIQNMSASLSLWDFIDSYKSAWV